MVWFWVDDGLSSSPKVLGIPREQRFAAVGLWTIAGSWCARHLTDGAVPDFMLTEWGADLSLGTALVDVGLWEKSATGFEFHDWAAYQQVRDSVEVKREKERTRKQVYRDKIAGQKRNDSQDVPADVPGTSQRMSRPPNPTQPNPTQPIKKTSSPQRVDALFAEFYLAYPRKVGKESARKRFVSVVRSVDPQVVIAAARRFAADPNLPEKQFVPHPASWLNAGRWDDEPLPSAGQHGFQARPGEEWMTR